MTTHTIKYIHKRRGCCKADKAPFVPEPIPDPNSPMPKQASKQRVTEDVVNQCMKENQDIFQLFTKWKSHGSTTEANKCKECIKQCFIIWLIIVHKIQDATQ